MSIVYRLCKQHLRLLAQIPGGLASHNGPWLDDYPPLRCSSAAGPLSSGKRPACSRWPSQRPASAGAVQQHPLLRPAEHRGLMIQL
eukprot:scaffold159829_cov46-Prasinocladus_malaysianus.AAC.2